VQPLVTADQVGEPRLEPEKRGCVLRTRVTRDHLLGRKAGQARDVLEIGAVVGHRDLHQPAGALGLGHERAIGERGETHAVSFPRPGDEHRHVPENDVQDV